MAAFLAQSAPLLATELSPLSVLLNILLLLGLIIASGAFSGSETVLFSLTPAQLQQADASHNPFRKLAASLMRKRKATLNTILIGNTAVNVLLFATSYLFFARLAASYGAWVTPVSAIASVLLVVIGGEVVPKVLAVTLADRLAPFAAPLVHFTGYVFRPLGWLLDFFVAEPLNRLILGRPSHTAPEPAPVSTEELKTLLDLNRHRGIINPTEDFFLREVIDLSQISVSDVMIPRVEVQAWDINRPADELRALIRESRLKKVPVYDGSIDNMIGLIYAKVLFLQPDRPIRDMVMPVRFVPEVITCEQLLQHFRSTRTQLAIVVDEFGGMAGLVTLEDVLEEIVGEIHEPEDALSEPEIRPLSDTEYDVSGLLSIHYWAEMFGLPKLSENVATVGGLVADRKGRPARVGDKIRLSNVELTVTGVHRRRVERLRLRLLSPAELAETNTPPIADPRAADKDPPPEGSP